MADLLYHPSFVHVLAEISWDLQDKCLSLSSGRSACCCVHLRGYLIMFVGCSVCVQIYIERVPGPAGNFKFH
jgi:hypothetical protein